MPKTVPQSPELPLPRNAPAYAVEPVFMGFAKICTKKFVAPRLEAPLDFNTVKVYAVTVKQRPLS
jgi:hypothetical protein